MEAISTKADRRWEVILAAGLVAAGGMLAFANSLAGKFVFDDLIAIKANPTIRHLWPLGPVLDPPSNMTAGGRPVLNLSLALNYAAGGLHPWGYHAVNLAIHVCAALALFGIVRRTWQHRDAVWVAAAVALVWVTHPLQTESVTYVVQRAESLMGLFYLLTLYAFIRRWYALSVLCCWLGMGTKEVMVSAPLVVMLFDRSWIAGSFREAWRTRRSYYGALFASWLLLAALILSTHGRANSVGSASGARWWPYVLSQFPVVVRYLWLSFWPSPLVFDYGTEWVLHPAEIIPCVAVVAVVATAALRGLGRRTALGVLGFAFFALLAPTSLVQGNRQTCAEHRMYLPLAAVAIAAVGGAYRAWGRRSLLLWPVAGVALGCTTAARNQLYAHPVELWRDTVSKRPDNPYARNNYGSALLSVHLPAAAAIQLRESLRLKPGFTEAQVNLGNALLSSGDLRGAVREYEAVRDREPNLAAVRNNLGVAYLAAGDIASAREELEAAVRLQPDYADAMVNLGDAWRRAGHPEQAQTWFRRAARIDPAAATRIRGLNRLPAPLPSPAP